jgi:hypothetical protein
MQPSRHVTACWSVVALALMPACNSEPDVAPTPATEETDEVRAAPVAPPPMITKSVAYRCTDGKALYVEYLTDKTIVNVRNSQSDIPVRMTWDEEARAFASEGRTMRENGTRITYSAPDRRGQSCRA